MAEEEKMILGLKLMVSSESDTWNHLAKLYSEITTALEDGVKRGRELDPLMQMVIDNIEEAKRSLAEHKQHVLSLVEVHHQHQMDRIRLHQQRMLQNLMVLKIEAKNYEASLADLERRAKHQLWDTKMPKKTEDSQTYCTENNNKNSSDAYNLDQNNITTTQSSEMKESFLRKNDDLKKEALSKVITEHCSDSFCIQQLRYRLVQLTQQPPSLEVSGQTIKAELPPVTFADLSSLMGNISFTDLTLKPAVSSPVCPDADENRSTTLSKSDNPDVDLDYSFFTFDGSSCSLRLSRSVSDSDMEGNFTDSSRKSELCLTSESTKSENILDSKQPNIKQQNENTDSQTERDQNETKIETDRQTDRDQDETKTESTETDRQTERDQDETKTESTETDRQTERDQDETKTETDRQNEQDQNKEEKTETDRQNEGDQNETKTETDRQTEGGQNETKTETDRQTEEDQNKVETDSERKDSHEKEDQNQTLKTDIKEKDRHQEGGQTKTKTDCEMMDEQRGDQKTLTRELNDRQKGCGQAMSISTPPNYSPVRLLARGFTPSDFAPRPDGKTWVVYPDTCLLELIDETGKVCQVERVSYDPQHIATLGGDGILVAHNCPQLLKLYAEDQKHYTLHKKFKYTALTSTTSGIAFSTARTISWIYLDNGFASTPVCQKSKNTLKSVCSMSILPYKDKIIICAADKGNRKVHFFKQKTSTTFSPCPPFYFTDDSKVSEKKTKKQRKKAKALDKRFVPISVSAHSAGFVAVLDATSHDVFIMDVRKLFDLGLRGTACVTSVISWDKLCLTVDEPNVIAFSVGGGEEKGEGEEKMKGDEKREGEDKTEGEEKREGERDPKLWVGTKLGQVYLTPLIFLSW